MIKVSFSCNTSNYLLALRKIQQFLTYITVLKLSWPVFVKYYASIGKKLLGQQLKSLHINSTRTIPPPPTTIHLLTTLFCRLTLNEMKEGPTFGNKKVHAFYAMWQVLSCKKLSLNYDIFCGSYIGEEPFQCIDLFWIALRQPI